MFGLSWTLRVNDNIVIAIVVNANVNSYRASSPILSRVPRDTEAEESMLQRLTCARASRDVAASASAPRTLLTQSVGTRRVSAWRCAAGTESAAVGRIACRSFSSSPVARADKDVVKDPEHPDGIYYHKLAEGRFAMSFFEQKPSSPAAASVMAIVTRPQRGDDRNVPIYEIAAHKPDQVETNKAFMALLHETMKAEGVPQDGLIEYEAALRKDGWAHVSGEWRDRQVVVHTTLNLTHAIDPGGLSLPLARADQRHQLMPGRIPTPENIIAVRTGEIRAVNG